MANYWRSVEAVSELTCYFTVAYTTLHAAYKILACSPCSCFQLILSFVNKILPKYLNGKSNQTTGWTSDYRGIIPGKSKSISSSISSGPALSFTQALF